MKTAYLADYYPAIPALPVRLGYPEAALSIGSLMAIVDTGADGTLVPQAFIDQLGAPLVDQLRIRSPWGEAHLVDIYTVDLAVGEILLPAIEVAGDEGQELILGRNVLNRLRIFLDGPAQQVSLEDA